DNGGPTQTMALLSGSPALDAGDNTGGGLGGAPPSDQRGFVRIFNGTIDIGAFEAQSPELVAPPTVGHLTTPTPTQGPPLAFSITVSAVVSGATAATPGGTAHVSVDSGPPRDVTLTDGAAMFDLPNGLAQDNHTVTVTYDGDSTFAGSGGSTTFAVGGPATTT